MTDLTRIQFKRSKTPNVRPAPDTVAEGEIILNLADRAILTKLGNEIIDLGFAKGGKVDGNIDLTGNFTQTNGHFNTTGNINVGGTTTTKALTVGGLEYSGIDIRQDTNRYLRLENTKHGSENFAILWKRDADDSNLSSFKFPTGHGTGATQQWVNIMIKTNPTETLVHNPDNTKTSWLSVKNDGRVGAFDVINNRWMFVHNQDIMSIYGHTTITSDSDYTNIKLKKSDGRYVQIETKPHAGSNDMLAFAYKQADGTNQHVMTLPYDSGTIASREWVNVWLRNGGANTETILQARENPGESFMFLRSNDHNIGFSLQGATKFRITPTAITTETGLRTIAINGTDNSNSNRPQLILDSKADLWRMEPDGAGKLQLVHPASGALYEFEKTGGTQQVASKQWVNSQGFQKGSSNKQYSRALRTLTGIRGNTWGSHTRGIEFGENLNNRIVFLESQNGTGFLIGNQRTVLSDGVAAWTEDNYVKYSWRASTSSPSAHKVTIIEFY
ncbi:putative long tail fiber distal subunit [Morganella phage vB_MmoM_Rgz1]|nr:putative long tail fiber distal subunit [Morganella phage vB_MmoM_Rgz1]